MRKHALPPTGGGYPFAAVSARTLNPHDANALTTVTLTLSMDSEAEARGQRVVELIRKACIKRDLDDVAILHILFKDVACRVPEFHVVVYEVIEGKDRTAIRKLLDLPRKGR